MTRFFFGKTTQALATNGAIALDQLAEVSVGLAKYAKRRPHLLRLIAGQLSVDDEPNWDSHIANDLEELAVLLDACWEGIDQDVRNLDLLSNDPEGRARQLLGQIIQRSKAACSLVDLIQTSETVTVDLVELATQFFKRKDNKDSDEGALTHRTALSLLLTLLANATINGRAVFPIRFHHFVTEKREGLVCLNPNCPSTATEESDGWWSKLYIQHSKVCSSCNSLLYPLMVCRKCGFAYLQAWRQPNGICG